MPGWPCWPQSLAVWLVWLASCRHGTTCGSSQQAARVTTRMTLVSTWLCCSLLLRAPTHTSEAKKSATAGWKFARFCCEHVLNATSQEYQIQNLLPYIINETHLAYVHLFYVSCHYHLVCSSSESKKDETWDLMVSEATNCTTLFNQNSTIITSFILVSIYPFHAPYIFEDGWPDHSEEQWSSQRAVIAFTELFIRGKRRTHRGDLPGIMCAIQSQILQKLI